MECYNNVKILASNEDIEVLNKEFSALKQELVVNQSKVQSAITKGVA